MKFLDLTNITSSVFYVISGSGEIYHNDGFMKWSEGDIFTLPFQKHKVTLFSFSDESVVFMSTDYPLIKYLNCTPNKPRFAPTFYPKNEISNIIQTVNNENDSASRNRNGILLSNKQMVEEKLNTLSHTMWSLVNVISPKTIQKPHRHNSIAIDLCTHIDNDAEKNCLVYTLMGR